MNQFKIFFLALIGALIAPHEAQSKACVNPVTVVCPQISCSSNVVYISQADLPYVISAPGEYCVVENLTWTPLAVTSMNRAVPGPSSPIAAITITASNVLLNLNGYTLQQSGDANYTVGIFITNGSEFTDTTTTPLSNIIVRNGTVQNIATAGILVNKVNEFLLEDLYVVNNGANGEFIFPAYNSAGGILYPLFNIGQSPFLNNHIWRNVHADSNSGNFPDTSGLYSVMGAGISGVNNVLIDGCTFNNNACENTVAFCTGQGLVLFSCTNLLIANCQANGNIVAPNAVAGPSYAFGYNGNITNFTFENCQGNENGGFGFADGFVIDPAFTNNQMNGVFSNCTANSNYNSGDASAFTDDTIIGALGFYVSSNSYTAPGIGITFTNCVANNQTTTVTGFTAHDIHAYGFALSYVQDVQMDNCIACLNTALPSAPDLPLGDGEGFYIDGVDVTLTNCRAEYNQGNKGPYGYSIQYDLFPYYSPSAYNVNLINCVAIGNPTDPLGIGIYTFAANNCVIEGCLIESNIYDGIIFDAGDPCPYTAENVVKHNQILAPNPVIWGSSGVRWAIEDLSATGADAPQNTYYDNYAWNYPGDNGLFTNYSTGVRLAGGSVDGLGNAYIAPWVIGTLPPSPTGLSKITNLDITNGPCVSD